MEGEIKVKAKFTIEQATKTQKGGRGIAFSFNLRVGEECVVSATPRPLYSQESHCTRCKRGWDGLSAGLGGCGKFAPTSV
jgi:hypothetical protein